ncbi:hypothetical protein [Novosphingobium lentum]|uniref:hypothetical protein n=1 Tax=Novosphingobium lentum TaxID=145287 RepID=UPI0012ED0621|nr:hypothetical protein [Novosphingobium lentum]
MLVALSMALGGCSYAYNLLALMRDGHIVFIVDPKSPSVPSCLRRIEVSAEGERSCVWRDSVDYEDACANKFPIPFGAKLTGHPQPEWPTIDAKLLRPGIIYEVSTTTGATGYGEGRFMIDANGRIVNKNFSEATSR